jgi:hypothetical protein
LSDSAFAIVASRSCTTELPMRRRDRTIAGFSRRASLCDATDHLRLMMPPPSSMASHRVKIW